MLKGPKTLPPGYDLREEGTSQLDLSLKPVLFLDRLGLGTFLESEWLVYSVQYAGSNTFDLVSLAVDRPLLNRNRPYV